MSPLVLPPRVRPGDTVALVAPAGPVPAERLARGRAVLATRYRVADNPRLVERVGYLAGDDDARLAELEAALADDQVRAIFCARGGYGAMRLLPRLDPRRLAARPCPIVGFSDITALHAFALRAGVASVHGPVVTQLGELPAEDTAALFALLEGAVGGPLAGLASIGAPRVAEGPLVGGNLELVRSLIGTPWAFPLAGAVLLLEEVGEQPYRLDRALTQLELAGALADVAAVVVGDLHRCVAPDPGGPTAEAVVRERLARLAVPVLLGLPVGHAARNRALGHGVPVRVDGLAGTLTPLGPAVA